MAGTRERIHEIIFEADSPAGKFFDLALLFCILASVFIVMLDSVQHYRTEHGTLLRVLEWVFTGLFTVEYVLRLYSVRGRLAYATSFFGVIDLLAVIPSYVSLLLPGAQSLLVIRILRLLRIFRVLKLAQFVGEAGVLLRALAASRRKITIFLGFVLSLTVILGTVMYLIEGGIPGTRFTSIPRSVYWAIITLTTVGYGDITPTTDLGQVVAGAVMLLGYGILAVPTGIVTVELAHARNISTQYCPSCSRHGHDEDARFCKFCGEEL